MSDHKQATQTHLSTAKQEIHIQNRNKDNARPQLSTNRTSISQKELKPYVKSKHPNEQNCSTGQPTSSDVYSRQGTQQAKKSTH